MKPLLYSIRSVGTVQRDPAFLARLRATPIVRRLRDGVTSTGGANHTAGNCIAMEQRLCRR